MTDPDKVSSTGPDHDFNRISPSAKSLLFVKSFADIPYSRQAAELVASREQFEPDNKIFNDFRFWLKVLHFEERYRSINVLLQESGIKNILELSSGFSFRGLEYMSRDNVIFIDTDLPDIVASKKNLIRKLKNIKELPGSKLEVLPLNALDKNAFREVVSVFPPGEITIINEGLLMYLDPGEKEQLCNIIHEILQERGGVWITGDIYVKNQYTSPLIDTDQDFFKEHQIEENKFDSYESARSFFTGKGFVIKNEAKVNSSDLISLKHLARFPTEVMNLKKQNLKRSRETWCLKTF